MARRDDPILDSVLRPVKPRTAQSIINTIIYTILTFVMILVLMPLFWMVLTALKTKGTAFSLQFLPRTEQFSPEFSLPEVEQGSSYLYFQAKAPEATTVKVFLKPDLGSEVEIPMHLAFDGAWAAMSGPLDEGKYLYRISINGEEASYDPRVESKTTDGFTPVDIVQEGVTIPGGPLFVAYRQGGRLIALVSSDADRQLAFRFDGGNTIPLRKQGDGLYEAGAPAPTSAMCRVKEDIPFGRALSRIYTLSNFRFILESPDFQFSHYFFNSLVVASSCAFLSVLICTLAGYAFAVLPFHFREGLFYLLLTSMLVPGMIYMVPQFSITLGMGLMNTYAGMVVPHLANVFGLFLLKQYIGQIPRDLFAAAEIDGARDVQVFQNIVIPVCLPIMVTLFLLVFVTQWSNFLWQLIINTGDSQVLTLPVGLQQFKGQNANEWERIMAGACFSILPITALFLVLQRYFLQGLTAGAVKE